MARDTDCLRGVECAGKVRVDLGDTSQQYIDHAIRESEVPVVSSANEKLTFKVLSASNQKVSIKLEPKGLRTITFIDFIVDYIIFFPGGAAPLKVKIIYKPPQSIKIFCLQARTSSTLYD